MSDTLLARKLSQFSRDLVKIYQIQRLFFLEAILVVVGAAVVTFVERGDPRASISSFGDGVWWSVVTVTSVGFGDKVPLTAGGKVIGGILAISGVMLFGIVISLFSLYFSRAREDYNVKKTHLYLEKIEADVKELKNKVEFLVKK